jgi:hypothetical protein
MPGEHMMQLVLDAVDVYRPAGQSVQPVFSSLANLPAAHTTQSPSHWPSPLRTEPLGHSMHSLELLVCMPFSPWPQQAWFVQLTLQPSLANVPAGQALHDAWPLMSWYLPGLQQKSPPWPSSGCERPGLAIVHSVDPSNCA